SVLFYFIVASSYKVAPLKQDLWNCDISANLCRKLNNKFVVSKLKDRQLMTYSMIAY
ncbi:MAG: hypothetical protein ACI8UC_001786, partial [Psychromonas sp.]